MSVPNDFDIVREAMPEDDFAGRRTEALAALDRIEAFLSAIEEAHREHLRTGDYTRLGMAAQDALRAALKEDE